MDLTSESFNSLKALFTEKREGMVTKWQRNLGGVSEKLPTKMKTFRFGKIPQAIQKLLIIKKKLCSYVLCVMQL